MANAFDEALQKATGGYPADRLIVTKNEENEPEVSMFVLDADNQLLGAPWESLQYYPLRDFWRDGKRMISA